MGILALMFISPMLAKVCLLFGSAEYFSVAVFSLTIIAALSGKDLLNGLIAGLTGSATSMVGMAPIDTKIHYTLGNYQLLKGFDITVLLIGVFAVTDIILAGFGRRNLSQMLEQKKYHLKGYGISMLEFIQQIPNAIISSIIGIVIGFFRALAAQQQDYLRTLPKNPAQSTPKSSAQALSMHNSVRDLQQCSHRRLTSSVAVYGHSRKHSSCGVLERASGSWHTRVVDLRQELSTCVWDILCADSGEFLHADL